ncbi:MAG: enoyl-CoA hydratase/isomerase family protein [Syntrophobacteraceae bacterium]
MAQTSDGKDFEKPAGIFYDGGQPPAKDAKEDAMNYVEVTEDKGIAIVTLSRGKVNALNEEMVDQIHQRFTEIEASETARAVILTGRGKFFSFGFDIPEFMKYSREEFSRYLEKFRRLYARIFMFPKPVVAALNGHTIAGGCMLATACDHRLMVSGRARISLNEISFGSSVFAGSVAILQYCVGSRNAQEMLYSAKMYTANEAFGLGLIETVTTQEELPADALTVARDLADKDPVAFKSIKTMLRGPVHEAIMSRETASIQEFLDIWYSESTWANLGRIKITD